MPTTNVQITRNSWTSVAAATKTGIISNTTGEEILLREAASAPASSEVLGHKYAKDEKYSFSSTAGLYARLDPNGGRLDRKSTVVVTTD